MKQKIQNGEEQMWENVVACIMYHTLAVSQHSFIYDTKYLQGEEIYENDTFFFFYDNIFKKGHIIAVEKN